MHRQNVIAIGLLVLLATVVVGAGYASGRGPLGVLSYGVLRLSTGPNRIARENTFSTEDNSSVAPEFATGNWINSEPLKLEGLRGSVVVIEFWTFGCYNCRNTLPYVKAWDARYRKQGLTIIGVHSPEFDEERSLENVHREVAALGIQYPVLTDNDYQTWRAYDVEAWPTTFVIDKSGRIRWKHVGEGAYDETEGLIQKLLAEVYKPANEKRD